MPSKFPPNDKPQFYFSELIPLFDFNARLKDAVAREDEGATYDLLKNFKVGDCGAYRISGRPFTHEADPTNKERRG